MTRFGRLSEVDRRIVSLAVPAFGALAAEPLYRLIDTAIVGRIGSDELGGVAIAVSVLSLVIAGSNFLAYGTTERVARRLGAADAAAAGAVGVQALWLAVIVGVLSTPLLVVAAPLLTGVLGATGSVQDFAVEYLRISALGVPFVLIGLSAQGVQRGASDYRSPLVVLVASNIVNAVVELVLVFGFDLGVAGAAWSTVIAQVLAGLALLARAQPHIGPTHTRRPLWSEMRPLLSAGRHLLLRVGSMLAVFTGSTAIAARVDTPTLAAHQVVLTVFLFMALSLDALAVPAQTLVAEELGRADDGGETADASGAAEVTRRSVRLSIGVGVVLGALLAASSPLVARIFSTDDAVIDRATVGLVILGAILLPGALTFATDGALIGAGDYRFLGRAAFGYLVAVAPVGAAVLVWDQLGIVGIWGGLTAWMVLRAVVNRRRTFTVFARPTADG